MKRTPISLGDIIRVAAQLEPGDGEASEAIREMLGIGEELLTIAMPGLGVWKPSATARTPSTIPAGLSIPGPPPSDATDATTRDRARRSTLSRISGATRGPARGRAPKWIEDPGETLQPAAVASPPPPPLPLFGPPSGRALLTAALATTVAEGDIDIDRVVRTIGAGLPLRSLPRRRMATLRRGVQLLLDQAPGMDPFHADQAMLVRSLDDVLSDDRLEILHFAGCPSRGVGTGARKSWIAWQPPPSGTPVLAVTDLGIGRTLREEQRATVTEWLRFAAHVHAEGRVLLGLVPYDASRWPPRLARAMVLLHWSERTSVGEIRRALRRGYRR